MGALCMLVLHNTSTMLPMLVGLEITPTLGRHNSLGISKSTKCGVKISYMLEGFSIEREHSCLRIAKCYVCISLRVNPPQTLQFAKSNPITKVCGSYAITLLIGSSFTLHEDLHDHSKRKRNYVFDLLTHLHLSSKTYSDQSPKRLYVELEIPKRVP